MTRRKNILAPTRATILVDIDGVLNAWEAPKILPKHNHLARAGKYTVVLDHRHPLWMRQLAEVADMMWASMWQAHAGPVFGAVADIGHDWPFLDFDAHQAALPWHMVKQGRTGNGVGNYKRALIEALAEDGRPLVWIDDDMQDSQIEWAAKRDAAGMPTLFVRPDPSLGLTYAEFRSVRAFAERFAVTEVAA